MCQCLGEVPRVASMTYIEVKLYPVGFDGVDEAYELAKVSNRAGCIR
jgi:hypothetical protein